MNVVVGTAKDGIRGLGQFRDRALVSPYRHPGDGWDRDVVEGSWMWVSGVAIDAKSQGHEKQTTWNAVGIKTVV